LTLLTEHRANLDNLITLAVADTVQVLTFLQDRPVPELAYQLRLALPAVAETYSDVAQTLAVDYYDASRAKAPEAKSQYQAQRIDYDTNTPLQSTIGYSIARITEGSDYATVTAILSGSMQRVVNGAERSNISFNIVTDPDGTRYERVPSSNACSFCLTMAAVAEVQTDDYFSKYHDNCRCTSRPVFAGQSPTELPIYKTAREAYSLADKELKRQRAEVGYDNLRRRQAAAQFPELTLTTENYLRLIRQTTGWR
jgi:hypothetical protein